MSATAADVATPPAHAVTAGATSTSTVWTRLTLVVVVAVYLAAFHLSYVTSIAPSWGYTGLVYQPAGDDSLAFAFIAALLPALALPIAATRPSDVILWLLYATAYVPAVIVPYYVLGTGWDLVPLTVTLLISMALLLLVQPYVAGRIDPPFHLSRTTYGWGVFVLAVVFSAYVASVFGVSLTLPDLASVYDVRSAYVDNLAEAGNIVAYAVGWCASALGPLLIAYGIASRRILFTVTGMLVMLFIYSSTGYKSVFLLIPVIAGLMVALRYRPRIFGLLVPIALTMLIALSMLLDSVLGSNAPTSLGVRRLLDVPGQLTSYYYEFFSSHQTYSLSHSILHGLIAQPYPVAPPAMIASVYDIGGSPNANLWADGMANLGLVGVIIATLVAIVVLKLLDAVARDRPLTVTGAVLGAASLSLINSGILTALLTHGLLFAGVLVVFMPLGSSRAAAVVARRPETGPRAVPDGARRPAYARTNRVTGKPG
jgi:hypothetical protein